jgi:CRP-like cAMP-binding protein
MSTIIDANLTRALSNFPIFEKLNFEELQVVGRALMPYQLPAGKVVYRQGDHGDSICFVVDGILNVVRETADGRKLTIASLSSGESLGEMAVIDGLRRSATVTTQTEASVLVLRMSKFEELLGEHPVIGIKVLKGIARYISKNLRKTSDDLTALHLSLT